MKPPWKPAVPPVLMLSASKPIMGLGYAPACWAAPVAAATSAAAWRISGLLLNASRWRSASVGAWPLGPGWMGGSGPRAGRPGYSSLNRCCFFFIRAARLQGIGHGNVRCLGSWNARWNYQAQGPAFAARVYLEHLALVGDAGAFGRQRGIQQLQVDDMVGHVVHAQVDMIADGVTATAQEQ